MKIKILRKNQMVLVTISLMLIAAGYLNYSSNDSLMATSALSDSEEVAGIGDAKLVSSTAIVENNTTAQDIENSQESNNIENKESSKETDDMSQDLEETSSQPSNGNENYYVKSRLERQTMYSQMLESYQKVVDNANISSEQKTISQNEITKINTTQNSIMIAENLIKSKGIEDVVIFVNEKSVNVVVKAATLDTKQIAQIQNIICRELGVEIEGIHISERE
ncbi:MAG: SpoIIIAH-like family protein [Clostridia bacterium]|nr:SpoIIIAH-like family protein [Clostridia bacterium]